MPLRFAILGSGTLLALLAATVACAGPRPEQTAAHLLDATSSPPPAAEQAPETRAALATATSSATPTATPAPPTATPAPPPVQDPAPAGSRLAPKDPPRVVAVPRVAGDATRIVVLDPGHGADEVGAAAHGVVEKTSNLDMAFRVEALLQQQGVRVVLTRRADERAYTGTPIQGYSATRRDLQARIDLANDLGADVFVSLHSNGSASTAERGVETYWNGARPFAEQNRALASTIQASVVDSMAAAGTPTVNRGAKDDTCLRMFQGRCFPLFLLGPPRTTSRDEVLRRGGTPEALGFEPGQQATSSRATAMPSALVELLFISSPSDAAWLATDSVRDTLARGVARGIIEYLNQNAPRTG